KETYVSANTGMLQHWPKLWRPRTHPGIKLIQIIRLYAVDSQPSIRAWLERVPRNDRHNAISLKLPDKRPRNSCKPARRVLGLAFLRFGADRNSQHIRTVYTPSLHGMYGKIRRRRPNISPTVRTTLVVHIY